MMVIRITPQDIAQARASLSTAGPHLPAHALLSQLQIQLGLDERSLAESLAAAFAWPLLQSTHLHAGRAVFDRIPLVQAMSRECLLLDFRGMPAGFSAPWAETLGDRLVAVIADPFDLTLQSWLQLQAQMPVVWALATRGDIRALLGQWEASARAIESIAPMATANIEEDEPIEWLSIESINADASPVVRLVNSTLYDALKSGASDIHIESTPHGMEIKYRIDGVLDAIQTQTGKDLAEQAISRLKVMAELDIAERRVPQDGRIKVRYAEGSKHQNSATQLTRDIDLRVSIMPSIHGEDAVLRILDKRQIIPDGSRLSLDLLGFEAQAIAEIRRLAAQPYGMLLVTGPTGSGKTTTLYGAISEIHTGRDKIITIEDPVEYELAGVLQIPVNEKKGLTFARGLRSILRHDPDKIMVGEIRDAETAEIAVQSALTGHLVLTTVHANNVFDVFNRFTHMGIDPYALTSALNGIWAQRLIRVICPSCAEPHHPSKAELDSLGLSEAMRANQGSETPQFKRGLGCGDCRGTGYKGRRAIAEILTLTDVLREMLATKQPISAIKAEARKNGTRYLRDAALSLAWQGQTTLEEVSRVTLQG